MKINRVFLAATAVTAFAFTSCVYDPYYTGSSHHAKYGNGYGYGSRNFTTTYFVRTSNPRWAYDPHTRCYYDHSRRCYYDPYLRGYYPVGYRPMCVQAAPHPHGWRSGSSYIPAPSQYRDMKLNNYQHRDQQYRNLNQSWSRNVHINHHVNTPQTNRYQNEARNQGLSNPFSFGQSNRPSQTMRTNERSRNEHIKETRHDTRSPQMNREARIGSEHPRNQESNIRNERSAPSARSNEKRGNGRFDVD